jgi:secondary thiamine-phosphate synthase enzyme
MLNPKDWLLNPHEAVGFKKYTVVDYLQRGEIIHHTEHLYIHTPKRYALLNVTSLIEGVLARSQIQDGFCFVSAMHITAGVYVNDAESGLLQDIAAWIEQLAPSGKDYHHHQTGEDNGDAHLKSYLTNHSLTAPVTKSRLDFGTWQQIFYAEFDGNREKRILVKVTGMKAM